LLWFLLPARSSKYIAPMKTWVQTRGNAKKKVGGASSGMSMPNAFGMVHLWSGLAAEILRTLLEAHNKGQYKDLARHAENRFC